MSTKPREQVIRELVQMRRNAKSMVTLVNRMLEDYPHLCQPCFYSFGLTDECRCEKKLT